MLINVLSRLNKLLFLGKKYNLNGQNIIMNKFLECGGSSRLQ